MSVDDIRKLSAYELAGMAGCATPDTPESAGAVFLTSVRDDVADRWEFNSGSISDTDRHEIADDAPAVYNPARWAEFVDLAAYREEPEFDQWPNDLTDAAGVALYQIAERLVSALTDELSESDDDTEGDDE